MSPTDQLGLLRRICSEKSQAEVARKTGFSSAVVCGVLKGTYQGNTDGFLARVEEVYGTSTVGCPGLGEELPLSRCAVIRRREFNQAAVNPEWLRLWKVCRTCPQNAK
jgi:hypothetical protein